MHAIFSSVAKQISQALKNVSYKKKITQNKSNKTNEIGKPRIYGYDVIHPTYISMHPVGKTDIDQVK